MAEDKYWNEHTLYVLTGIAHSRQLEEAFQQLFRELGQDSEDAEGTERRDNGYVIRAGM